MSAFVALFAALLSLHGLCSADDSGASGSADALLPASCPALPHVVMNHLFQLRTADGSWLQAPDCSFWAEDGSKTGNSTWSLEGGGYVFHTMGDFNFTCDVSSGSLSVVMATHSIALCRGCGGSEGHVVNSGDVVVWGVWEGDGGECEAVVVEEGTGGTGGTSETTDGFGYYQFTSPGSYVIYCEKDPSINTTIKVVNGSVTPNAASDGDKYQVLLYTHAVLMLAAFGVLLPSGAFLAFHRRLVLHKIIQPFGITLAVSGLTVIVAHTELSGRKHFGGEEGVVHGVLGLVLLAMAALVMPLLLLRRSWRKWHKKCGHLISFFGMGNTLLGLAILPVSFVPLLIIRLLYALWLLLLVAPLYIFLSPQSATHTIASRDAAKRSNGLRRSSSASSGPQPLRRGVISDNKMVELRKVSVAENPTEYWQVGVLGEGEGGRSEGVVVVEVNHHSNSDLVRGMSGRREIERPRSPNWTADTSNSSMSESSEEEEEEEEEEGEVGLAVSHDSQVPFLKHSVLVNPHRPYFPGPRGFPDLPDNASLSSVDSTRITRHSPRAWMRWSNLGVHTTIPHVELETSHIPPRRPAATLPRRQKPAVTGFLLPPITTAHSTLSPLTHTPCPRQASPTLARTPDGLSTRGMSPCSIGDDSVFTEHSPKPHKKVTIIRSETSLPALGHNHSLSVDALRSQSEVGGSWRRESLRENVLHTGQPSDAVVCTNRGQEIVLWSSGAVKMFGYRSTEAVGSSLELIIPQRYKARHRQAVSQKNGDLTRYLRKHSYTPPEQKTARIYSAHGVAKNGKEFPVEVRVSSFVVDGELYYAGVITELHQLSKRVHRGPSTSSERTEATIRHKALVAGAQLKIAHNLESTDAITHQELSQLLTGALEASNIEAGEEKVKEMVAGIMRAGNGEGDVLPLTSLIQLLPKHGLNLSESGIIAHGNRTRGPQGMLTTCQKPAGYVRHSLRAHWPCLLWLGLYLALNAALFVMGVVATKERRWQQWAYGMGPVLSMNCVLVLLPTLKSLVHNMRSSLWMSKIFPLSCPIFAHALIFCGILFWSTLHILTHLSSYTLQNQNYTAPPTKEELRRTIRQHLHPVITGFLLLLLLATLALSSVRQLRSRLRFIPFFLTHWTAAVLFYLLLLTHGERYYNPAFWKWLIPAVVIVVMEQVYRYSVSTWFKVRLVAARPYCAVSSVGVVELDRPKGFHFQPGQYILLNIPWIGKFHWQPCYISGGLNKRLVVYLPWQNDAWLLPAICHLTAHPYSPQLPVGACGSSYGQGDCGLQLEPPTGDEQGTIESNVTELSDAHPVLSVHIAGPYGLGHQVVFDYRVSVLVCAGAAPHPVRALLEQFLRCKKKAHCSCHPPLSKLYLVWIIPSGKNFEWFTDYLADFAEDDHWRCHLDIRVFLTAITNPPDDLSCILLQLGLRVSPSSLPCPHQPQMNNLFNVTAFGLPDFDALLDTVRKQHSDLCDQGESEVGVFTIGCLHYSTVQDLREACRSHSQPGKMVFKQFHFKT